MTTNPPPALKALLPSPSLFYHGKLPEALSDEERQWLVEQLHAWPKRVNEARTCAIGALTDMAVTEFCRLMAERTRPVPPSDTELVEKRTSSMMEWRLSPAGRAALKGGE